MPPGASVIDSGSAGRLGERGIHYPPPGETSFGCRRFDWRGLLAVRADREGMLDRGPLSGPVLRVSGERSVSRPTRLETRTKESNACASHWALRNLKAK